MPLVYLFPTGNLLDRANEEDVGDLTKRVGAPANRIEQSPLAMPPGAQIEQQELAFWGGMLLGIEFHFDESTTSERRERRKLALRRLDERPQESKISLVALDKKNGHIRVSRSPAGSLRALGKRSFPTEEPANFGNRFSSEHRTKIGFLSG